MSQVIIIGGYGEDKGQMGLYVDGKLISVATIDGGNDAPESVADFLYEFGVSVTKTGITDISVLDAGPALATDFIPYDEEEDEYLEFPNQLTEIQIARLLAGEQITWV